MEMQGPGGADEDRRGGFERGGWAMGSDDEAMKFLVELYRWRSRTPVSSHAVTTRSR
jgi:hypothetical protein